MEVVRFRENKAVNDHSDRREVCWLYKLWKFSGMFWSPLCWLQGVRSLLRLTPRDVQRSKEHPVGVHQALAFPLSNAEAILNTQRPRGADDYSKKQRQKLRCSEKPPTVSCCNFALEFNSILQHQTGNDNSLIPCLCPIVRTLNSVSCKLPSLSSYQVQGCISTSKVMP